MPRDVVPMLPLAAPRFAQQIELAVIRQDEMRLVADDQAIADVDPGVRELVDLGEERLRIDDHAVADDAGDALVQDAGRQQAQHELPPAGVDGVTGVVASLVAGDDREIRRQQIDDLALAFVAPLRAEHCDVHKCSILPCVRVLRPRTLIRLVLRTHDGDGSPDAVASSWPSRTAREPVALAS